MSITFAIRARDLFSFPVDRKSKSFNKNFKNIENRRRITAELGCLKRGHKDSLIELETFVFYFIRSEI